MKGLYSCLSNKEKLLGRKLSSSRGDILFHENDACHYVGLIIKGEIAITSISYEGKEVIFNLLHDDDLFGHNLLFSSSPFYKGDVIAKSPSLDLILYKKEEFVSLLSSNKDFLEAYLNKISDNMKLLNQKVKLLSFSDLEERFFYYLHYKRNKIDPLNISTLAKELRCERETLSRLISKLQKENKILRNGKAIEKA